MKFIKMEWTGCYVEGKMYKTTEITKKEAVKLINEGMGRMVGERLIDDLIWEGQCTPATSSSCYQLPNGLRIGIAW